MFKIGAFTFHYFRGRWGCKKEEEKAQRSRKGKSETPDRPTLHSHCRALSRWWVL